MMIVSFVIVALVLVVLAMLYRAGKQSLPEVQEQKEWRKVVADTYLDEPTFIRTGVITDNLSSVSIGDLDDLSQITEPVKRGRGRPRKAAVSH